MRDPFKQLDYFTSSPQDCKDYAGREEDIRNLCTLVLTSRVSVLYGRSGLGKTSLLQAGLFPRLKDQGYTCIYVRVLDSPLGDLAVTLAADIEPKLPSTLKPGFVATEEYAGQLMREAAWNLSKEHSSSGESARLLVVFDQFEEFFTLFKNKPEQRYVFVQEISALVRDKTCDITAMFSLREDHLCALDDFQRKLPDLFSHAYRLMPLTVRGAREAIVTPLENRKIHYDERLVDALLDSLAIYDFESVRLQLAASEVYRRAQEIHLEVTGAPDGDAPFELARPEIEAYITHGAAGIFRRYLDKALGMVPNELRMDACETLDVLITEDETRQARARDELRKQVSFPPDRLEKVLQVLRDAGVTREIAERGEAYEELRHERLIQEIRIWQKEIKGFAEFLDARAAIRNYGRNEEFRIQTVRLLSADMLRQAVQGNMSRLRLSALEREFVLWSAIRNQMEDLKEWARKWFAGDDAMIAEALQKMIDHKNVDVRAGAARAVPLLAECNQTLLLRCSALFFDPDQPAQVRLMSTQGAMLATQLTKPPSGDYLAAAVGEGKAGEDTAIQQAAAKSFVQFATPAQNQEFKRRIKWMRNSRPVRGILAEFFEVHRAAQTEATKPKTTVYSTLRWWQKVHALRAWREHRLEVSAALLRRGKELTAKVVLTTVIGFVLAVCLPIVLFLTFLQASPSSGVEVFFGFLLALIPAAVAGIFGWRCGTSALEVQAIYGTVSATKTAGRTPTLFWFGAVIIFVAFFLLGLPDFLEKWSDHTFPSALEVSDVLAPLACIPIALALSGILRWTIGQAAHVLWLAGEPSKRLLYRVLWTAITSQAIVVLILCCAISPLSYSERSKIRPETISGVGMIINFFLCSIFACATAATTLSSAGVVHCGSKLRLWPRLVAGAILLGFLSFTIYQVGPATLASLVSPPKVFLGLSTEQHLPLSDAGLLGACRYRLKSPGGVFRLTLSGSVDAQIDRQDISEDCFFFLPAGTVWFAASKSDYNVLALFDVTALAKKPHAAAFGDLTIAAEQLRPLAPVSEIGTNSDTRGWIQFEGSRTTWAATLQFTNGGTGPDRDYMCQLQMHNTTLQVPGSDDRWRGNLNLHVGGSQPKSQPVSSAAAIVTSFNRERNWYGRLIEQTTVRFTNRMAKVELDLTLDPKTLPKQGESPELLVSVRLVGSPESWPATTLKGNSAARGNQPLQQKKSADANQTNTPAH